MFCCLFSVFILDRGAVDDRKMVLEYTAALAIWETKRKDLLREQLHPELGAPYRRPYPFSVKISPFFKWAGWA